MKNKKSVLICLTVALLLSTFTACSRRNHYEGILESNKAAESSEDVPETNGNITGKGAADYETPIILQTGNTPFYEEKTLEDLQAVRRQTGKKGTQILPNGCLYDSADSSRQYFYNKVTGNMSDWCSDPLCDGSTCIWQSEDIPFMIQYISDDYIYFLGDGDPEQHQKAPGIFRCDLNRNHVEKILDVASSSDGNGMDNVEVVYEKDNMIYYHQTNYQGTRAIHSMYVLDLDTGETHIISGDLDLGQVMVIHDAVYYTTNSKYFDWNRTDLNFSSHELCWENAVIEQYNERYIVVRTQLGLTRFVLDMRTGEKISLPDIDGAVCLSGDYLYYLRPLTEQELESDPLKDYYTFTWTEQPLSSLPDFFIQKDARNKDGGRIYRVMLGRDEIVEECVFQLIYKDVPVRIRSFAMDGDVMYVTFHNHECYKNYYTPEFEGHEDRTRCHGVVDLQNGSVTILKIPEVE